MKLGMATGRIRLGFFHTWTRPAGQDLRPGPSSFTNRVFFFRGSDLPQSSPIQSSPFRNHKITNYSQAIFINAWQASNISHDPCFHFPHFTSQITLKKKIYRIYQLSNQKQYNPTQKQKSCKNQEINPKKKLGNEPKEVDIGLGNLGNFTPQSYGEQ